LLPLKDRFGFAAGAGVRFTVLGKGGLGKDTGIHVVLPTLPLALLRKKTVIGNRGRDLSAWSFLHFFNVLD
jgi:hypothetical protein